MARRTVRRDAALAMGWLLLLIAGVAAAANAAGPPFPSPQATRYVYDTAGAFSTVVERSVTATLSDLEKQVGARVVVYTQIKSASITTAQVHADATALVSQWKLDDGAAMFWDFTRNQGSAIVQIAAGPTFLATRLNQPTLNNVVQSVMAQSLNAKNWSAALIQGTTYLAATLASAGIPPVPSTSPSGSAPPSRSPGSSPNASPSASAPPPLPTGPTPPAGPPYPEPVDGVTVYDYASVFSPATIESVSKTIADIEERTGAEVVVYTQVKPESNTPGAAEKDAIALIDQWGVGRKGFDDGLAILLDLDASKCHGQVQLYGAPGYRAAYLTNGERQAIFDDDMRPYLAAGCDLDGALLAAMSKIDAAATPEHAQKLQTARQLDAAVGLVVAPLALIGLVGWAGWSWFRYGRDPVYLDDPSILAPAPPAGLTPTAAALIMDGHISHRCVTTAMVHLASRGEIAFKLEAEEHGPKMGLQLTQADEHDAHVALNRRGPTDPAEDYALERLQAIAHGDADGYISPHGLLKFGTHVDTFDDKLDQYVVERGWYKELPQKSIERWSFRASIVLVLGVIGVIAGAFVLPSSGVLLLGVALFVASIAMYILARVMPQRTMAGAMTYAILAAYRRTLQKTMEQARSMDEVVASKTIPWLQTPDLAVVWGVALGLHDEVEEVLKRSAEDTEAGTARVTPYFPVWYGWQGAGLGGDSGGGIGVAPGLFSAGALPDFGGMMSALGTIGRVESTSSSHGGGFSSGGFSGGGSGGGGGGAGGGF